MLVWGAGTTRTMRVYWTLYELDKAFESRPIGSRTGETQTDQFTALNPKQKIPVIEDGSLILSESAAICLYLAEQYGDGLLLPPADDPHARARHLSLCFFVMTELDAHTLYVLRKHADLADLYGSAPNAERHAQEGFQKQVAVASHLLDDRPFLTGNDIMVADVLLCICLDWAVAYKMPLDERLMAYRDRLRSREAYKKAFKVNYEAHG